MKSNWKLEILGKFVSQQSIQNPGLENIEVYSVTKTEGFIKSTDYFKKEVFSKNLSRYKLVKRNQFAYNPSRINVGSIAFLSNAKRVLVSPLYIVFEVDKNYLSPDYLLRYLKSPYGYIQIRKNIEGSVRDSLKYKGLEKIQIPLPPLDDQIRINTVLTRIESIITKRKGTLITLDELEKNTFLKIFEFNNSNYQERIIEPLNINADIVSGITKGKKYNVNDLQEVPYMRVANVQDGYFDFTDVKTIQVTEKEIERYKLIKGDLLLTEGGDPDKLGRGAVWNNEIDNCIHQNHIFRVRIKDASINPIFLSALIASKYGKDYFLKAAKQTTGIATINSTQLKAFPLIKPPIHLQNKFAKFVEKIESLRAKLNQSLTQLESLYGSLSQRAFKGELNLSKVPVIYETDKEIGEVGITGDGDTDMKLKTNPDFSNEDLFDLIKKYSGRTFSFNEIWKEIEMLTDRKIPLKTDLQEQIIKLLETDQGHFTQVFNNLISQDGEEYGEKQIAFRSDYEN